jgi:hypothetical protein
MTPEGMTHLLPEKVGSEKRYTKFDREFSDEHPSWHEKTSDQPSLHSLLQTHGLTVLVAPHHGLESCYSPELYDAIKGGKPQLVVISEKRHLRETDGSVDSRYQKQEGASGLKVVKEGKEETCLSVSTINGWHILIVFGGTGRPKIYAEKDPVRLLTKLE